MVATGPYRGGQPRACLCAVVCVGWLRSAVYLTICKGERCNMHNRDPYVNRACVSVRGQFPILHVQRALEASGSTAKFEKILSPLGGTSFRHPEESSAGVNTAA